MSQGIVCASPSLTITPYVTDSWSFARPKEYITRTPIYDEDTGEITFSEPQLDPHASQLYIEKKYLNQSNEIKIFNTNLIKFVDTKNLYVTDDVIEVDIEEDYKSVDFFYRYKNLKLTSILHKYQMDIDF